MKRGHGEKLSRKKEASIAALLQCPSIKAAAAQVGVDEKTLRAWMANPSFAKQYRKARAQITEHAVGLMQQTCGKAIATLHDALSCDVPGARIRAAQLLLEQSLAAVQMSEVLSRLDELETAQKRLS